MTRRGSGGCAAEGFTAAYAAGEGGLPDDGASRRIPVVRAAAERPGGQW
ncbi:hypothetical protein JL475_25825 [Streptomyces sp. M2CJ-2]|nr:hypothetical protein [Streptomyces sp. M2CJ-2]MBL3669342.1 hypothetical protein [Streptomyces sp. M2CJ-2]